MKVIRKSDSFVLGECDCGLCGGQINNLRDEDGDLKRWHMGGIWRSKKSVFTPHVCGFCNKPVTDGLDPLTHYFRHNPRNKNGIVDFSTHWEVDETTRKEMK